MTAMHLRALTEEEMAGAVPEEDFNPERTRRYAVSGPEADKLMRLVEMATQSVTHAGAAMAQLLDMYANDPRGAQRARSLLLGL